MNRIHRLMFVPVMLFTLLFSSAAAPMQATVPAAGDLTVRITQVDTSRFPQVTVYISVTDATGEPVSINPDAILLQEDGKVITPSQVNGTGEGAPLTTLLVLDISGSMNHANKLENARSVAKAYIGQSRLDDRVGILAFNESIDLVQGVTSNQDALVTALDNLKAKDDTAMYDALVQAISVLNPLDGRKAIIVLTDGMDNHSRHTPQDVLEGIGQSGLSISTIGLGNPGQSTGNLAALDEAGLRALAEQAGGQYGYANDLASLQALYELYGRTLKSEYAITYISPATLHDGFNRNLSVSLVGSNLAPLGPETESKYNPGGVLPETSGPSWPLFFGLLAALLIILTLPFVLSKIRSGKKTLSGKPADKEPIVMKAKPPAKPRIKLK